MRVPRSRLLPPPGHLKTRSSDEGGSGVTKTRCKQLGSAAPPGVGARREGERKPGMLSRRDKVVFFSSSFFLRSLSFFFFGRK